MKDGTIYKDPRTNRFEAGLMVAAEQRNLFPAWVGAQQVEPISTGSG